MTTSASLAFGSMGAEERAAVLGVPVITFAGSDSAPAILRVMTAATEVNDDIDAVTLWIVESPVAVFRDRTPLELILGGRAQAIVHYLASKSSSGELRRQGALPASRV